MKHKVILPLLALFLGWLCSTILAPLAIEAITRILEPDYIRANSWTCSPTEREMRKAG